MNRLHVHNPNELGVGYSSTATGVLFVSILNLSFFLSFILFNSFKRVSGLSSGKLIIVSMFIFFALCISPVLRNVQLMGFLRFCWLKFGVKLAH